MPQDEATSANARVSALALLVGACSQLPASMSGQVAMPWAYAGWLAFAFGAIGLCQELGASKPLNRGGLLFLAAAFCARTIMLISPDPAVGIRAQLTSALTSLAAVLLWSVALMHRSERPRLVGAFGSLLSGSTLILLVAAHVMVGGMALFGFDTIFRALHDPETDMRGAMLTLAAILSLWSFATAALLWTRRLNSTRAAAAPPR